MLEILKAEKVRIINEIISVINKKNLDITFVCKQLFIEPNEFVKILKYPNSKISIYMDILELVTQL